MARIYESMFVLDNTLVRQDWKRAKAAVTDLIEKHGGSVHTARHWGERRLAYTVRKQDRATFLLAYTEVPREGIRPLRRDLELSETVLRYLMTRVEAVPEGEAELSQKELEAGFVLPSPEDEERAAKEKESSEESSEKKADEKAEEKPAETPKEGEESTEKETAPAGAETSGEES